MIFTNSASEYWHGDGALLHVGPLHRQGLARGSPTSARICIAGTDHFGSSKIKEALPAANPVHRLDVTPVNRALLVALENWVADGVEPPASQVPRTSDGTAGRPQGRAVRLRSPLRQTPAPQARCIDLGPDADRGIGVGRSSWASHTSTWFRRSTRTATKWPASACPPSPHRSPRTPAGTPRRAHRRPARRALRANRQQAALPAGTAVGRRTLPDLR